MSSRACVVLAAVTASAPAAAHTKEACARAANEAQVLRDAGKFRDARSALSTCASAACPAVVTDACRPWLSQVETEIPTVVFDVRDAQDHDLVAVRVLLDGVPLVDRMSGTAVPLDPGAHTLRFEAEGFEPAEERVLLRVKEKDRVLRVRLEPSARMVAPPARTPSGGGGSLRTIVGLGLGVLAVGATGASIYFVDQSNDASRTAADLRQRIGSSSGCFEVTSDACGKLAERVDAEHHERNVAAALFVTAGVFAISAVATWLFWPSPTPRSDARMFRF